MNELCEGEDEGDDDEDADDDDDDECMKISHTNKYSYHVVVFVVFPLCPFLHRNIGI